MQIDSLTTDIEHRLATTEPQVEVLACEQVGRERLRLFIDHPQGVDLGLCSGGYLRDLLLDYGLRVSSPGPGTPAHQARSPPLPRPACARATARAEGQPQGFTGELVGASDDEVTVAADSRVVTIPYSEINRSNLLPEAAGSAGRAGRELGER